MRESRSVFEDRRKTNGVKQEDGVNNDTGNLLRMMAMFLCVYSGDAKSYELHILPSQN